MTASYVLLWLLYQSNDAMNAAKDLKTKKISQLLIQNINLVLLNFKDR